MPVALLRHGEVDRPAAWPQGRVYVGQLDLPLSELGRQQARAWAQRFKGDPPAVLHASDLARTAETAAILGAAWGVPVRLDPAWREIALGAWEGRPMDAVRAETPALHAARGADPAGVRPPAGEGQPAGDCMPSEHFGDLARRVWPAYEALLGAVPPGRWGLAVTHAGVIRTLLLHLQGRALQEVFTVDVPLSSLHWPGLEPRLERCPLE